MLPDAVALATFGNRRPWSLKENLSMLSDVTSLGSIVWNVSRMALLPAPSSDGSLIVYLMSRKCRVDSGYCVPSYDVSGNSPVFKLLWSM